MFSSRLFIFFATTFILATRIVKAEQDITQSNDVINEHAINDFIAALVEVDDDDADEADKVNEADKADEADAPAEAGNDDDDSDDFSGGLTLLKSSLPKIFSKSGGLISLLAKIGLIITKVVLRFLRHLKKNRDCLFEPLVAAVRLLDTFAMGVFNVWESYRRANLPMLKSPKEIFMKIASGKADTKGLIRSAVTVTRLGFKTLREGIKIIRSYVQCRRDRNAKNFTE